MGAHFKIPIKYNNSIVNTKYCKKYYNSNKKSIFSLKCMICRKDITQASYVMQKLSG